MIEFLFGLLVGWGLARLWYYIDEADEPVAVGRDEDIRRAQEVTDELAAQQEKKDE